MTMLAAGARLGPYEITGPLGAGGMGEVYRARDSRLDRDVAVKVLPAAFAADPGALARFEREAKAVAALSHPNILSIFDFGTIHGGTGLQARPMAYAAMELLDGQTLRDRLAGGALPLRKAIEIALQIAHGLAAAHEKGIIHRDLKPENVFVTTDGRVKILDFGLAKAMPAQAAVGGVAGAAAGATVAAASDQTTPGTVLGTVGYMSPEQITGAPVDHRTDIFAFGAIVYEMLAGRRAFKRNSTAETIAAILKEDPPELSSIGTLPPAIDRIVRRCLEKNPAERFHSAHDIGIALEALSDRSTPSIAMNAAQAGSRRWWRGSALPWGVAALAIVAAAAAWIARVSAPAPAEAPLRKFHVQAKRMLLARPTRPHVSPDGRRIVFAGGDHLWVQDLDRLEPRQLAANWRPRNFFWSPDGAFVAFASDGKLWKVPVSGGPPIALTEVPFLGGGAAGTWRPDGRIVFTRSAVSVGVQEVSQDGGEMKEIFPLAKGDLDIHDVAILPDGRSCLAVVHRTEAADTIVVLSPNQPRKDVLRLKGENLAFPQYSATGHVVFARGGKHEGIWAVSFALGGVEVTGEPFLVAPRGLWPSVSDDGTLTYVREVPPEPRQLVTVTRAGKVERALGEPQPGLEEPTLSPDGSRVAVAAGAQGRRDIWIYDVARAGRSRLTFLERNLFTSTWSRSGDRILFSSPEAGEMTTFAQPADGTGQPQKLFTGSYASISGDGRFIAFARANEVTDTDLWYQTLTGDRTPKAFLERPGAQHTPVLSPDSRYLAYQSNDSGRYEVYIKPFPSGAGQWQVSFTGGGEPSWSPRGDKLWYRAFGNILMEVDVKTSPTLTLGQPREIFKADPLGIDLTLGYQVVGAGERFLAVRSVPDPEGAAPSITVVQNWLAEFKNKR